MFTATSTDGTTIAFDRLGRGHPLVIVGGAFSYRSFPLQQELAQRLSDTFDVISYDRRGRGDSGDARPYSVAAEVDDLAAVIEAVGGSAYVWGISSGGALAIEAAARGVPIDRLAVYDPPFVVTPDHGVPPQDLLQRVQTALDADDPDRAVRIFMTDGMGAPSLVVGMLGAPFQTVAAILLAVRPGDVDGTNARLFRSDVPARISGGPQTFTLTSTRDRGTITVTPRSIQYTGGWWYCARYHLTRAGRGTRVSLTITDVSASPRWTVWIANRGFAGFASRSTITFRGAMSDVAHVLDCPLTFPTTETRR